MTATCDSVIHLCAIRVTRLDALGHPVPGPNNVYVTNSPVSMTVTPQIEAGEDKTLVGGCDCIVASYRGYDKLKRFNLDIAMSQLEPGLLEMLIGSSVITATGNPIGMWWQDQLVCGAATQPNVAVEAWQDNWSSDHQDATYPYLHWIWPSSYWQIGAHTLQNDFLQPTVSGFTRSNPVWGVGIYGDAPQTVGPLGGFFYDTARPTAQCGYQTHSIT